MNSLINHVYILMNLETNKVINIKKIIGQKQVLKVINQMGGRGSTSHQKGILEVDYISQINLEGREFSNISPLGKYLFKNDESLHEEYVFQIKGPYDNPIRFKVIKRITLFN